MTLHSTVKTRPIRKCSFSRSGVPSDDLRIGVPSDDYAKLDNKAAYRRPENIKNVTGCGQSNN